MSRDWTQEEFKGKDGKMTEECRLITKEEYDKYMHIKTDNARLRLENAELREQLELLQECVPPYSLERIMIELRKEKEDD